MRRPRRRPQLPGLRARLARLRKTCDYLVSHAELGADLRAAIAAAGSATWTPAEDLSWRTWIERQGDEEARRQLAALDELIDRLVAEMTAKGRSADDAAH